MNYSVPAGVHIGHVHLKVSDLERALSFYKDLLGFQVMQLWGTQAAFYFCRWLSSSYRFKYMVQQRCTACTKTCGRLISYCYSVSDTKRPGNYIAKIN